MLTASFIDSFLESVHLIRGVGDYTSCCDCLTWRIETPLCGCQTKVSASFRIKTFPQLRVAFIRLRGEPHVYRLQCLLLHERVLPADKRGRLHSLSYANTAQAALWRKNLKASSSRDTEVQFSIRKMLLLFSAFESIMKRCCTHSAR